jgi:hypothetical protein
MRARVHLQFGRAPYQHSAQVFVMSVVVQSVRVQLKRPAPFRSNPLHQFVTVVSPFSLAAPQLAPEAEYVLRATYTNPNEASIALSPIQSCSCALYAPSGFLVASPGYETTLNAKRVLFVGCMCLLLLCQIKICRRVGCTPIELGDSLEITSAGDRNADYRTCVPVWHSEAFVYTQRQAREEALIECRDSSLCIE